MASPRRLPKSMPPASADAPPPPADVILSPLLAAALTRGRAVLATPKARSRSAAAATTPRATISSKAKERDAVQKRKEKEKAVGERKKAAARGRGGGAAAGGPSIVAHTARSYHQEKQQLLAKHEEELAAAQERYDADLGRLDEELKDLVADLRAEQRKLEGRLHEAAVEHEATIREMRASVDARLETAEADHNDRTARLEAEHADAVARLQYTHESETARAAAENASLKMELEAARSVHAAQEAKVAELEKARADDKAHILETLENWKAYYEGVGAQKDAEIQALEADKTKEIAAHEATLSDYKVRVLDLATRNKELQALVDAEGAEPAPAPAVPPAVPTDADAAAAAARERDLLAELDGMRSHCALLTEQKHRLERTGSDMEKQLEKFERANARLREEADLVLARARPAPLFSMPAAAPVPFATHDIALSPVRASADVLHASPLIGDPPAPAALSVHEVLAKYAAPPLAVHASPAAAAASPLQAQEDAIRGAVHASPVLPVGPASSAVLNDAAVAARAEAHLARIREQLAALHEAPTPAAAAAPYAALAPPAFADAAGVGKALSPPV
eukprot:TRINITY_DN7477_c0_g1_i1.p1 TRINITY_DN7477_c0_g1~~TRINITY_DN7477_c0_g1_i1.p1  ORF type:complete len:646 (+),score=256.65 TRINITY_DN7477_c0_g1_i1:233-1939(+)